MATCGLTLTFEMELLHDAVSDMERIMRALVKCHGQPYRMLERRIEQLMDGDADWGEPKTHWIGGGRIVFEPFPEMKAVIRDARELGVI